MAEKLCHCGVIMVSELQMLLINILMQFHLKWYSFAQQIVYMVRLLCDCLVVNMDTLAVKVMAITSFITTTGRSLSRRLVRNRREKLRFRCIRTWRSMRFTSRYSDSDRDSDNDSESDSESNSDGDSDSDSDGASDSDGHSDG
jgi:hypothetical protein